MGQGLFCESHKKQLTFLNTNDSIAKKVILVCGGPNVGKTTHCKQLVEDFGYGFISYQEFCEASKTRGPNIQMCEETFSPLGAQLLKQIVDQTQQLILIEGFPRSQEDIALWDSYLRSYINVDKIFFLFCSEEEMKYRGAKRKGADFEKINTCVNGYLNDSLNMFDDLANYSMFTSISTMESIDNVYSQIRGELELKKQ